MKEQNNASLTANLAGKEELTDNAPSTAKSATQQDTCVDVDARTTVPRLPVDVRGAKNRRQSHKMAAVSFMLVLRWCARLTFENVDKQCVCF